MPRLFRNPRTTSRRFSLTKFDPYFLGVCGVVLATLVRLPFEVWLQGSAPYGLYYLVILFIAWHARIGPTIVTTALSSIAAWYFFVPERYSFVATAPGAVPSLGLFLVVSTAMIALSRKAAEIRAEAARNDEACRRAERGASAAIWEWNAETRTFETVALAGLFGLEERQALVPEAQVEALVHPDDRVRYREGLAHARESDAPHRVEFRIQHPTRGQRWLTMIGHASPRSDDRNWVSGLTIDITERKEAEEAAAQQREWFRVTLRSIGDAVIASDAEGSITFMNPVAEQLTGWSVAEALGRPLADVFHIINEKTREPVLNPVGKVMRTGVIIGLANHTALIARDGQERPIADSAAPIHGENGALIGVILVFHDVSEERRAADAIAEQREWFEKTLESIGDAVIATDVRGRIVFMNPVAEYLTGWRLDQVRGDDCAEVFRIVNEATRATVENPVGRVLREGTIVGLANHTVLISSGGVERPIDDSGAPIRSPNGRIIGVVLVFRDISERRTIEIGRQVAALERERLLESERAARSDAERANWLKDEFLATVSHELRTPLNAIVGWAHVLQSGPPDAATLRQALDVIDRNASIQTQLISDLLDMSQILSGKMSLKVQQLEIVALLEATLETVRPAAEAKQIEIHHSVERLPPVMADPGRLQQVIWNLLSNAIKFTPQGGRVTLVACRVDSYAEIAVSDTGIGIRPEFLEHVFERFRQGDASTTRQFGGLGLGLSIVKQLVEQHGGNVVAESAGEGLGTTIRVRLPIGSGRNMRRGSVDSADPCERIADVATERLRNLRVLVVDDQRDTRDLVARLLEECRASVLTAASGSEALEHVSSQRLDLLICDIGMPGMDGYTLIRRIRELPEARVARIPAIALTAFARPEDRTRAFLAGYQAHLIKPIDPAELIATVASFADLVRTEDAASGT